MVIATARAWFDDDRNLFRFYGGQFVASVFPALSDELGSLFLGRVATDDREEFDFVLGILGAYDGEALIYSICKEIAALLPVDDDLVHALEMVLNSTGVMTGFFGGVEGLKRKKTPLARRLAGASTGVRRSLPS
jgi:hypothetical protein